MDTTYEATALPAHKRAIRMAAIGVPLTVGLFLLFVVSGIAGFRGGWLWAPLMVALPAAVLGWFGWGPARGRAVATSIAVLLGIAFGVWSSQEAVMSHGRLSAEFESLRVPEGFGMVSDEPGGWSLCFDVCTNHTRKYLAAGSTEQLQESVTQLLGEERFVVGAWKPVYGDTIVRGHRGRLGISVVVADWMFQDRRRAQLPPGHARHGDAGHLLGRAVVGAGGPPAGPLKSVPRPVVVCRHAT